MDLVLHGNWEGYNEIHFVWEAKLVGDKRVNSDYRRLNSEYVNEAIYRFIRGDYATGLPDGGVLGYVLAGDVENIVGDINLSMGRIRKNPPLPESNHLQSASSVGHLEDIYQSRHTREDRSSIQLHHLFLTFDFVDAE